VPVLDLDSNESKSQTQNESNQTACHLVPLCGGSKTVYGNVSYHFQILTYMKRILILLFAVLCLTVSLTAQRKSISSVVDKMQKIDGYVPVYFNPDDGKIYLEISRLNTEFLYLVSLPTGVGSNPIGLDRAQLGPTRLVHFERSGNKLLLVQPNYRRREAEEVCRRIVRALGDLGIQARSVRR